MSGETQVGAIKAKMELDARGFNQELQKAKQNISASADEARKVNKDFKNVTRSLYDLGLGAKEVRKIQQELQGLRPDLAEQQVKNLEVQLRRLGASDEHIDRIKTKMNEMQQEVEKSESRVEALHAGLTALGAGAMLAGLLRTIQSLTQEAQRMAMSYQGLTQLSKALNIDIEKSTGLVKELANKGFMSITEAADAVKTSLASGLNLDETKKLILSLADAAAYNRQANYGWGESVVVTLQGIKQGNSVLTDAVGVTTNLSVMYDRYAKSIGTTAGKLTDAQKIQAAYNGFIADASIYAGNADSAMQGYAGTQAHFNQTMQTARVELGESFMPVIQQLMNMIGPIIQDFALWAGNNKDVVAGLAAAAVSVGGLIAGITGLLAVVAALRAAFIALNISMGPIGWAIAAVSAVAIGTLAYNSAAEATAESVWKFAKNQEELNAKLSQSPLVRTTDDLKNMEADIEKIKELIGKKKELEKQAADTMIDPAALGQARGLSPELQKLLDKSGKVNAELKNVNEQLSVLGINTPNDANKVLSEMNKQMDGALDAKTKLIRESMRETIAHADNVKQMKDMSKAYEDLNSNAKLTEAQKAQLENVVKRLKQEYPDLIVQLDEENRWHIKNKDALDDYITGESNRVKAAGEASIKTLNIAKVEAEARVRLARESLKKIQELENGPQQPAILPAGAVPDALKTALERSHKTALDDTKKVLNDTINNEQFNINDASKLINDISTDNWDVFRKTEAPPPPDKQKKGKTLDQIQQEQYQNELKLIDRKRAVNKMSEKEELDKLDKLAVKYKKNADISGDLEVRIYQLKKQMENEETGRQEKNMKDRLKFSQDWIEQEERNMKLAGKSEQEISQMKLDAWTRVRNRFDKDNKKEIEYFKQAETQLYNARITLMKESEQAQTKLASTLEKSYTKRMSDSLKQGAEDLKKSLDAIDNKMKDVNKSATDQTKRLSDAIQGVNDELAKELGLYDAQIKALDNAKQQDDRNKTTDEHNSRLKALKDQKAWISQNGADPFEIAALDRQIGDEQRAWSEQQKQWQFDDERTRLENLKSAAQERADVRRKELEDQISAVEHWKETQIAAFNDEKQRLNDHWNNEETGVKAIMENGLLATIAGMAAHDQGFKERGEKMIQNLLDGIAGKKATLETELADIQSLISSVSGVTVPSQTSIPSTINTNELPASKSFISTGMASAYAAIAAAAASATSVPRSITANIHMDGKVIARETIPIIGKEISQPIRSN